ncbi:hypothetical protein D3C75_1085020 [compost metagenome]
MKEQGYHSAHNQHVKHHITASATQNLLHAVSVMLSALLETCVKPAEQPGSFPMATFSHRFEQGRAKCRRQNQCNQHRQRHRRNDSY